MGNKLCKCREGKKRYAESVQATDEEITKKVLPNTGNVLQTIKVNGTNTSDEGSVTKDETKKPSPKDNGNFKGSSKKTTEDNNGGGKSEEEDSSEETSSESSSSSSESSDDEWRRKKFSKKKSNGGVTIVSKSKKTVYKGTVNHINMGNVTNTTVNITSQGIQVKSADTKSQLPAKEVNTESSVIRMEERLIHNTAPGCFIQLHGKNNVEPTLEAKVMAGWFDSVCQIRWMNGTATGFRVGPNHIMTALHVVDLISKEAIQRIGQLNTIDDDRKQRLAKGDVYAVFDYEVEGYQIQERNKFYFKDVIHFEDKNTDSVVLELQPNSYGTEMPPPFACFSILEDNVAFKLVGHDGNKKKAFHDVKGKENVTDTDIETVRAKCEEIGLRFEVEPFDCLRNPDRYLFHSIFTKGASGSPGLITDGVMVAIVTMLLHGYPDGYYDENEPKYKKDNLSQIYRVEQGANMKSIYMRMMESNPRLCRMIFQQEQ